ncbi:hypothetical protein TWF694_011315 [Orbilia ellipsospora]|uniref:Uncharacterized protein n=1 Tax=Orbilia ellipsospora TaxID=2528407 RepID=A0AAV9X644_9PEZI
MSESQQQPHNTRHLRDSGRVTSFGVTPSGMRDLNAHEWSQAVINELESVQVMTPPVHESRPAPKQDPERASSSGNRGDSNQTVQRTPGQLELPQRPQAGTTESTATIDVVKQIPGGW